MNMLQLIEAFLLKNRTLVSADFERCMAIISDQIPLTLHRYPTGSDYGTWIIPPQWDVKKAVLSDGNKVIASYEDHPLFLAPYSCSFTGWIDREELFKHIRTAQHAPDAYYYEHRLAYDYQRRLKEWLVSLPESKIKQLDKPRYYIDIEVETKPGHMLVGESTIMGQNNYTFALLTHLCHTGQANDGLANVAIGIEIMKRLKEALPNPKYNYQLLILPETIGSAAYLSDKSELFNKYLGCVSLDMGGIKYPLLYGRTRKGNGYLDRILTYVLETRGTKFTSDPFTGQAHYWNDEKMFDSPGVGIPSAALNRGPFPFYHTSRDDLMATDEKSLVEIVEIMMDTVNIIEDDFIPRPRQNIPFYLTRFNLYADAIDETEKFDRNAAIMEQLWSGTSVFDIALKLNIPFDNALSYVRKFVEHKLLEAAPVTPSYFRFQANELEGSKS